MSYNSLESGLVFPPEIGMKGNMRPGMTTHTKSLIPTTKNVQLTFQESTGVLMSTGELTTTFYILKVYLVYGCCNA